ncbi:MAG: transcriptional regulator [Enterobacter phage ENC9]|nr:MAG: transcriptional regulator [Enterobacter phage ENC9]
MKIGSRVYVSFLSGSKIAGETGTVVGTSARDGYKVRTDFGVVGYVKPEHVTEVIGSDAPTSTYSSKNGGYVVDEDVAHMYLTQVRPLPQPDPTDLLCKAVRVETPFLRVCGWVTDQWIEDGVELLNVVFDGKFAVVSRSFVTHVLKFTK